MTARWLRLLFVVSALYDGVLGLLFLFFWRNVFRDMHVTPPNHAGYVQFPALLLIIFGWMFLQIARDPSANRDLIAYGIALKSAYCGVVFWHELSAGIPDMWVWFAWIDFTFLVLYALVLRGHRIRPAEAAR
jgi:hypothetical protein